MTVEAAVALACRCRGIEPIRIVTLRQVVATAIGQENWDEPMPVLF